MPEEKKNISELIVMPVIPKEKETIEGNDNILKAIIDEVSMIRFDL